MKYPPHEGSEDRLDHTTESFFGGEILFRNFSVRILMPEFTLILFGCASFDILKVAESGNTDKARKLIAIGANVNAMDEDGRTALMYATLPFSLILT